MLHTSPYPQGVEQPPEGGVASVASVLLPEEIEALATIALALPDGWVVAILAPHGQVAIAPDAEMPYHTRCWQADRRRRTVRKQPFRLA